MKNNNMSAQEENSKLTELIAKLREVFPFPVEKDWDKGYDHNKKDGWHLAGIVHDPVMCLEIMIGVCEGMKADARNDKALHKHGVNDPLREGLQPELDKYKGIKVVYVDKDSNGR